MKQQLKSYSWFLFPLSLPPLQRYSALLLLPLCIIGIWWSWIYNPLRKQRAVLLNQLITSVDHEVIIGKRLSQLHESLQQVSCKELSTIASLSRVTFEEIKFLQKAKIRLSFLGSYDAILSCLHELYERCPHMHIDSMHMEWRNQTQRSVNLEISNFTVKGNEDEL